MMLVVYRLPLWVLVCVFVACFGGSTIWMYVTSAPGSFWVVTACWFAGLPFYVCAMKKLGWS